MFAVEGESLFGYRSGANAEAGSETNSNGDSDTNSDTDGGAAPEPDTNHARCALFAAIAALALSGAAEPSAVALTVVVAVVQVGLIVCWVFGTGLPGRTGGLLIGAGAAAGSDVAVSLYPDRELGPLLIVLGLAVPAMFLHQLARGVVRTRTTESLSKIALLAIAVTALTAFVQLRHDFDGSKLATGAVLATTVSIVVGHLADMLWSRPRFDADVPRGLVALVAGTLAGGAAGAWALRDVVAFTTLRALYVGLAVAAVAGLLAVSAAFAVHGQPELTVRVASDDNEVDVDELPQHRGQPRLLPLAQVLLPIALAAPAAYLICIAGHG